MKLFSLAGLLVFSFLSLQTFASWDGIATGTVKQIDVTTEENLGFRVYLKDTNGGNVIHCGTHDMAYLNKSSSNYETYVSLLLAAKMSQTSVVVYSTTDVSGYCLIGYVVLNDQ